MEGGIITKQCHPEKIKIFLDADDTILNSSDVVIDILNKRYKIQPEKTYLDLKDWSYKSIYNKTTKKEIFEIYESDDFFSNVIINPVFYKFYFKNCDKFDFYIVTKGTPKNLKIKKDFFNTFMPKANFIGCPLDFSKQDFSKSFIDMKDGIQIDDRCDCLNNTNAKIKILFTHGRNFQWNDPTYFNIENRYDCENWDQICEILNFSYENSFFMEG